MLRGWQYLCRPTRWRLWEGCRAGRERNNSVRRGQGFLYGGPVRNNAHARRYFSAAKGFGARMKKKKSALGAATGCMPERRHLLEANESQTLRACGGKKKKVMLRGWQYLCRPTRWRLWEGCRAGRERKNSVRRGQGFLYGGPVRNNAHARRYFSAAKGFWGSDKKKKSALGAATGCIACGGKKKSDASRLAVQLQTHQMATVGRMPSRTREEKLRQEGSGLHVWRTRPERCACEESLRWKKKNSDASRLAVPLQTHQMATVGRMPSRTREEKLRQEGSGLHVWRTRPERCACEEVLLCCKGFLGLGYKKKKSALVAATGCMPERRHLLEANESQTLRPGRQTKLHICSLRWKKKKVMLRGWQYLCRPTRWRLWEGCRAGRERKNSVRRGQGFLYGGPVRNNAHARRYFSAAKGFWGSDEKKEIRVRSSHRVHSLRWKKKKVMLRGWQYLCRPTRWRLWEGCRAGRERKNSVRRGQGFLYGRPVRNNAHARRYFSAAKGFWGSDEKKKIRVRSSHQVHDLLWCLSSLEPAVEKKKLMLRGWQYLCRPTRWRLWEGCRAGRERKNSVRRVRASCMEDASGTMRMRGGTSLLQRVFGARMKKKEIRVRSSHRVHGSRWTGIRTPALICV
ncbi:uncharacterized protein LOC133497105 isoform X3 [Syngnathoides biaculeatus]|uniref:uncharacterized protein LOC133497105 isoform X3 n=1 Tax=Syngnathoides biaculeatus TaxID=300417 RepID=UPI002ADD5828|nr:uncharacterized protein LOC133497105 isoform X3 [Syngnathoides biaculeatus]